MQVMYKKNEETINMNVFCYKFSFCHFMNNFLNCLLKFTSFS